MPIRPWQKIARVVALAILWATVFFVAGYFPVLLTRDARASMVVLAGAAIPFGMTARSVRRGLVRGVCYGLVGGAGMAWALIVGRIGRPELLDLDAAILGTAVVAETAVICVLFAYLAQRRRHRLEERWMG